jgi:hypothetical protein
MREIDKNEFIKIYNNNSVVKAAKLLNITPPSLYKLIKTYNLEKKGRKTFCGRTKIKLVDKLNN